MAIDRRAGSLFLAVEPWVPQMRAFVASELSVEAFVAFYDEVYRGDPTMWSVDVFDVLDGLWAAADDYEPDPELRDHVFRYVSADELRERVRRVLELAGVAPDG